MNPIPVPGGLTSNQHHDYPALYARGYRTCWFQHWNRGPRGPLDMGGNYDFGVPLAFKLEPGVWAPVYEDESGSLLEIGHDSAKHALALRARHLMFDCEPGTDTSWLRSLGPLVNGSKAAGWTGPVHLTPVGAPEWKTEGVEFWDYGYDLAPFLATGGGIFPQAYYSTANAGGRHPNYAAKLCVAYYHGQLGVPLDRLNLMLWTDGTNSDALELALLKEAGLGAAMTVFQFESTSAETLAALEAVTKPLSLVENRRQILALVELAKQELRRRGVAEAAIMRQPTPLAGAVAAQVQDGTWLAKVAELQRLLGVAA